ncbi:MAG TPA: trypsin-like peptidase domain-containing protein [Streptosporangiaceae bacterium]|nr:trypsin-like peptidase domain-containing protein [Streptosporangiaceae bacterium]
MTEQPAGASPGGHWWVRRRSLAAGLGAAAAAALVASGMFVADGGLSGSAAASSMIPTPPSRNRMFVEDDNGTGVDNQSNILQSVAPGLVHVLSGDGQSAGVGIILTPSGLVLTSDQVVSGAGQLSVRTVLAGRPFAARVLGASATGDLALIQIEGATSPFRPVTVGNSRYFAAGDAVTALGSDGVARTVTLDLGNLDTHRATRTVAGHQLTGLLQSSLQVRPGQETGGPLVNLSGQVVGIDVGGAGSGLHAKGFAIPVNRALAVARELQSRATH